MTPAPRTPAQLPEAHTSLLRRAQRPRAADPVATLGDGVPARFLAIHRVRERQGVERALRSEFWRQPTKIKALRKEARRVIAVLMSTCCDMHSQKVREFI